MLTNCFWFGGGVFIGVLGTLVAFAGRRYIRTVRSCTGVYEILTMERVSARVGEYLSKHPEIDEIAVTAYKPDNLPKEVATAIKGELPQNVQHILILVAIMDNVPQKPITVFLAEELEPSLQISLDDGIFKVGR